MYEVTCFHCGNIAHITPDAERCIICGEDLKHLITPDYAAHYFYQRGAQLAEAGEVTLALFEVERGLRYQRDSQLHLLAAILCKRAGNFAQMRQHVAAIAVDDPLRGEAEWLLRSQQSGQLVLRQPEADDSRTEAAASIWPPTERLLTTATAAEETNQRSHPVRKFAGVVALLFLAAFTAWLGLGPGVQLINTWLFAPQTADAKQSPSIDPPVVQESAPSATVTERLVPTTPALLPSPTPTATVDAPPNVAQAPVPNEPVAASTPQDAVQTDGVLYDLQRYLQASNQPELADLAVAATLQGVTLTLKGIVPMYILRQNLVDLAQVAPGVSALDAVDLLVRTPLTYTVIEGDNLWVISYKLYGEDHRAELLEANRTTLLDPSTLRVGQILNVPPEN